MKKLGITLETGKTVPQIHQMKEDPDVTEFKKLFNKKHTVNGLEVKIQSKKEDAKKDPYLYFYNNQWKKK